MPTPSESDGAGRWACADYRVGETVAGAVVSAVAEATGRSALEMDPLWNAVDTDALNALFGSPDNRHGAVSVSFEYAGRYVTVTDEGIRTAPSDTSDR